MKLGTVMAGCVAVLCVVLGPGCTPDDKKTYPYTEESQLFLPGTTGTVWAIAPTINISGVDQVDPLLESDLIYAEFQQVHGLTVIPVNRVAQVYASLRIEKVQSEQQARAVCEVLGCDGLIVPTVTAFDPYDPPKLGASLQLFLRPGGHGSDASHLNVHDLEEAPTANPVAMAAPKDLIQAVGMFDASDGTVRDRAKAYSMGRIDPNGPLAGRDVLLDMDKYSSFVYHELLSQLLDDLARSRS